MVLRRLALLVVGVLLLGAPLRAQAPPQDELPITLNCKPPSFKNKHPQLAFTGSCPLSNGIILRIGLHRIGESLSAGQLMPNVVEAGGGNAEVEDKKINFSFTIDSPGKYMSEISFPLELQEKDHVTEVKKRTATKGNWQFEFLAWSDDLVPILPGKLLEISALVAEARDFVKRCEQACASEQTWKTVAKVMQKEGGTLSNKISGHELRAYFPAAIDNLFYTMRNVSTNAPYYSFGADGKFSGATDYHADGKKVKTFRNEDFSWDNLKRYVEDTIPCAGREYSLWMVKDLRRTGGTMRPEIQDAIKTNKTAPGVDAFAERIQKATIGDLDQLEADIRGIKK
jgi:hypothetical protein